MTAVEKTGYKELMEETESYLQRLRQSVLLWTRGTGSSKGFAGAPGQLESIEGRASEAGLADVALKTGILKECFEKLLSSGSSDPESESLPILDCIAAVEAEITGFRFEAEKFDLNVSDLIDESFDSIRLGDEPAAEAAESESEDDESWEEFGIDQEMLEIFAMEAEDHLKNINVNLELLEKDPDDREALLEIRRSSHTLKGSAGIVGLKKLAGLAHKVEDLLDHISEHEIEGNAEIFHLLLAATDCISGVINDDRSGGIDEKIEQTLGRFEKILGTLGTAVKSQGPAVLELEKAVASADVPSVQEEVKTAAFSQPAAQTPRSVVRISLDRLDDLVTLVREMVFGRAVFQQRLSELELQIKELQNSTRRLQRSTGKLETDFASGPFGMTSRTRDQITPRIAGNTDRPVVPDKGPQGEFDSLELDEYTEFHQVTRDLVETTNDTFSIASDLNVIRSYFESLYDTQRRLVDEIQDKLLSLRMIRFGNLAARLQRTVRMTADELEKLVELSIEGEHLEVDTQILDALVDPLLHLLRNAVAHGIEDPETRRLLGKEESGHISLRVYSEGTHIVVTVSDDGAGISADELKEKAVSSGLIHAEDAAEMSEDEALSLVFLPGLTTADEISQIAGRGVGMNVVKTNIARQKGSVTVSSEFQQGTTFTMRVPMALAMTRALLVRANRQTLAFPLNLVKQISEISASDLGAAIDAGYVNVGSGRHSLAYLNDLLGVPLDPGAAVRDSQILLLDTIKNKSALFVDEILRPEEVVIKPLGHPLKERQEFLGATILGDGTVVPVVDVINLLDSKPKKIKKEKPAVQPPAERNLTVLIVDDSPSVRHVNSRLVKTNKWEPLIAKDGTEALDMLLSATSLPDVILTDVEMPEMDGYELLSLVKQNEKLKHIPVIMITSRAGDKHRQKAVELGVSEYLTKPYEDSKLVAIIKRAAGKG